MKRHKKEFLLWNQLTATRYAINDISNKYAGDYVQIYDRVTREIISIPIKDDDIKREQNRYLDAFNYENFKYAQEIFNYVCGI